MRTRFAGDRGAVLPLAALLMGALLTFTSLAVDIGFARVATRDMQALADVVSLDLARRLDGRTAAQLASDMDAELALSVARNNRTTAGDTPVVTYRLGTINAAHVFSAVGSSSVPDAVEVTARTNVDYFFRPGSTTTSRTAVGNRNPIACYTIGSFALGVSSSNSALLNALVADALNTGVLSYNGLVTSSVTLLELGTQLGLGSASQLAGATVSARNFMVAVANVLQQHGDTANASLLNAAATTAGVGALPPIALAEVVALSPSSDAALGTSINALDLIAGGAFVANGTNALLIPSLAISVGTLAQTGSSLRVVERPRVGCGPAAAPPPCPNPPGGCTHTSQTNLALTLAGNVNLLGLLGSSPVTVSVAMDVAEGDANLTRILCGDSTNSAANPQGMDVSVLTALLQTSMTVNVTVLGTTIRTVVSTNQPSATSTATFRIPPQAFNQTVETGTGTVGLSGASVSGPTVVGGLSGALNAVLGLVGGINAVLGLVTSVVVNPLISQIDALLLGPLTQLLGLNVAGADVAARSIFCSNPGLQA